MLFSGSFFVGVSFSKASVALFPTGDDCGFETGDGTRCPGVLRGRPGFPFVAWPTYFNVEGTGEVALKGSEIKDTCIVY